MNNLNDSQFLNMSPVYRMLKSYCEKNPARFHMPGHKGAETSPLYKVFGDALPYDVTEVPETDNLFEPEGAFLEAERLAAKTYHTRDTVFSCGGSTLSIEAMLRLTCKEGGKVLVCRNAHKSVINTLSLLGAEPIFVLPRPFCGSGLAGRIEPCDIEKALSENDGIDAVFVTSPDYFGVISDIKGIAKVCHKNGVPLLVDNAHGAHLVLFDGLHPISQGADMACDSAHKTLPALTGASFLHINNPKYTHDDAKAAMMLFGSTSPSYFISLSLDLARVYLDTNGKRDFLKLAEKVAEIREFTEKLGFFAPQEANFDPVRIFIDTASRGITGNDAAEIFRKKGISVELSDNRHLVLIPSPFNSDEDFRRLKAAISDLPLGKPLNLKSDFEIYSKVPERKMTLREALFRPSERVSIDDAVGKVSAETKCPCPPCIPVIMPGEVIEHSTALYLKSCGVSFIKVLK